MAACLKQKQAKKKKCSVCKSPFNQFSSTQKCCSWQCALKQAEKDRIKKEKLITREKKEALKPLGKHLKEARDAVNAFIRERDRDKPCISCNRFHNGKYDAGHYRSVGAAPHLQFNEDNIHKQCVPCNQHKSGSAVEYRINLVKRIGVGRVEALENNNQPVFFTIEQAKQIKKEYREKLKLLKQ